ncbi:PGL/p-HBAD biosynthesis glycosyltransferase Rv2957/MT3031 [Brevibacterium casei]|nr:MULTISPECIES: CDP-glycerol glycerophosphotransferase family protein [Brevibacterium]MCM1013141.1 CDP-glycerol glycerophosphotransferase family protein [Brevibacterium sp. XM4083]VEW10885.1 PGL/p-HBAD biosynthesis glycosyltransferase Rv2957/MT3031 [Brevibacterium casei]
MPQFSLISAVYNVEQYLPDFLRSLDEQTFDHSAVQVVLVDDGSTDSSAEIIEAWAATTDYSVEVIHQANAGQAAARNTGLDHASGSWVSFPDPDDILEPEYLAAVHDDVNGDETPSMVVCRLIDFWEARNEIGETHPLRFRFQGGTQMVDIDRFPRNITLHSTMAFFLRDRVERHGLRFDPRIRPVFEDAHFIQSYLLACDSRKIVFDAVARYIYRRRADGSSSLQTSSADPRRYTDVLRYGLLELLKRAKASGPIPLWLQNIVLYEVFWILRSEESLFPKTGHLSSAVAEEFCEIMAEVRSHIETPLIEAFDLIKVSHSQRETLLHGFSGSDWSWDFVQVQQFDAKKKLVKLRYRFTGERPDEVLKFRGLEAEPMYAKTRAMKYLGRPLLFERILWVSARGTITISLNGMDVPITESLPTPKQFVLRPARAEKRGPAPRDRATRSHSRTRRHRNVSIDDRITTALADSPRLRRKFKDAWVFMDRMDKAGDNAEHLFKYVRSSQKNCNAWFVLDKDSPDWARLKAEGVDRLIAHGSRLWKALCLNAELLVSSNIERNLTHPFKLSNGRQPQWDHVFLQHGVTKDDLSGWLNTKTPRLVVTTTEPEHQSIVGDGGAYALSNKETMMTGMPRYDRLALLDASRKDSPSSTITFMPTWRRGLVDALATIDDPSRRGDLLRQSDWWLQWSALMRSQELRDFAGKHDLRLRFVPHPSIDKHIEQRDLPDDVELVRHADMDFQSALVDSRLMVTDTSSVAFDAAFIDRPVVYFQFDVDNIYGGGHTARPGYFSFDNDGFGPVVSTASEAVAAIVSLVSGDDPRIAEFARRRSATFTLPKTGNCERTYKAIARSLKVVSPKDGTALRPNPTAQPTRYLDDLSRAERSLKSEHVSHLAVESQPKADAAVHATTEPVHTSSEETLSETAPTG